jgi:LCP family protein required for cell wall assembly
MIEDELRAAFARHEPQAPAVAMLRPAIARLAARRRRRRARVRAGGVALLALAVLVGVPPLAHRAPDAMPDVMSELVPAGPLDLLLIGLDPPELVPGQPPRSDTIIVVHIPADRHSAYLVSIERDVEVDIPGHGPDKINAAYPSGGAALLTAVVEAMTGIDLDGTVTVTLPALATVTDVLGGIRMCLPAPTVSIHTGRQFPVGCSEFDGAAVADLARQRFDLPLGGYDRDRNVQRILIAIAARAGELDLRRNAGVVTDLLRVNGITVDLPGIDPVALALALHGIAASDIIGLGEHRFEPTGNGNERLDPVVTPELFAALRDDTVDRFVATHPTWVLPR